MGDPRNAGEDLLVLAAQFALDADEGNCIEHEERGEAREGDRAVAIIRMGDAPCPGNGYPWSGNVSQSATPPADPLVAGLKIRNPRRDGGYLGSHGERQTGERTMQIKGG